MESLFVSWAELKIFQCKIIAWNEFFDIRLQVNHILSHIYSDTDSRLLFFYLRHFAHSYKDWNWTFQNDSFRNFFWIKRSKLHKKSTFLTNMSWASCYSDIFFGNERSGWCNEHFQRNFQKSWNISHQYKNQNEKKKTKNYSSGTTNNFCIFNWL